MPTVNTYLSEHNRANILCYGLAKTKKTWWALRAAEWNFNVLVLDGDRGASIARLLPEKAQKRIYILDVADDPGRATFIEFLTLLFRNQRLFIDEHAKRFTTQQHLSQPGSIMIDTRTLDPKTTVVVLDSITAVVDSLTLRYMLENNLDPSDPNAIKDHDLRGYFGWTGRFMTWVLDELVKLNVHVVAIGHRTQYEKHKQVVMGGKTQDVVEWSRQQVMSTSGPHAMTIPKRFDDMLYFYNKGSAFKIDAIGDNDKDGGGRFVPPSTYNWDVLTIAQAFAYGGVPIPPADTPLFDFTVSSTPAAQPAQPSLVAGAAQATQLGGATPVKHKSLSFMPK